MEFLYALLPTVIVKVRFRPTWSCCFCKCTVYSSRKGWYHYEHMMHITGLIPVYGQVTFAGETLEFKGLVLEMVPMDLCLHHHRYLIGSGQWPTRWPYTMLQRLTPMPSPFTLPLHPYSWCILQNSPKNSSLWPPSTSWLNSIPPLFSTICWWYTHHTHIYFITNLKIILTLFKMLSGVKINYTKSHIFIISTTSASQIHIASSILQCKLDPSPSPIWIAP